ncbi:MAG TPA: hypothetical protein VMX55_10870 [candidate division Zixibacteria bacterium]|nr:hypothetical protein [candidate division Zixibacteria bacterium]
MISVVRKIFVITSLILCFISFISLPIFIQAQNISDNQNFNTNALVDPYERSLYFFKKGQFAVDYDAHSFSMTMKENKIYVAKLWITADDGGIYYLRLKGDLTEMEVHIETSEKLEKRLLEVKYTADDDTTGRIVFTYYTAISDQIPTYTLYANKAGFAGIWWIILASIGILTVFVVMFSFTIIGIKSTAKKRSKKRKK